jgi:hypothetical protein
MLEMPRRNRGTIIALALLAGGVAGTVIDPNGPIGITLFGVAAVAAVSLIDRPFRKAVRRLATTPRLKSVPRRTVVRVGRGRTVGVVTAAASVLFAIWLTLDLSRPLVYATWWAFSLLAAWLIGVALLSVSRSLRNTA